MYRNAKIKKNRALDIRNNFSMQQKQRNYVSPPKQDLSMYGAVDLGTNNCRLLIAQPTGKGFRVITSFSRVVRLGEGLLKSGYLNKQAMDRTIRALRICSNKLKTFNVINFRSIATEACRQAQNCDEFFTKIKKETGIQMETVTSNEEARLALRGCQSLLNSTQPYAVVFDIGGGSTEIIWAKRGKKNFEIIDVLSLPYGVVTLAEEWMTSGIDNQTYEQLVQHIATKLPTFCIKNSIKQRIKNNKVQMLGTSGTVTTLGAVHLNLNYYDRSLIDGLKLTFHDIERASKKLTKQDFQNRSEIPCIGNERAELVIPGCAILEAICKRWLVGELSIADRGLREGMLLELMVGDGIPVTGNPAKLT